jgi:2-amino-4-hydroxy-6-hydroxymethyldihydropteridine diphosphokinase
VSLAAISFGSNLGDRATTLASALVSLRRLGRVVAVSSFLETDPVGYLDQPRFLNGAVVLETDVEAHTLLDVLLAIEQQHGRDRSHGIQKGPRTLDLDLLLYDDSVVHTRFLTVPHPEMHVRRFVLGPLAEIAPAWVHPVLHRSIQELLEALPSEQ